MSMREILRGIFEGNVGVVLNLPPTDFLALVFMALVVLYLLFGLVLLLLSSGK